MNIEDDDNLDLDELLKIEKKPETLEERVKKDIEFINNETTTHANKTKNIILNTLFTFFLFIALTVLKVSLLFSLDL